MHGTDLSDDELATLLRRATTIRPTGVAPAPVRAARRHRAVFGIAALTIVIGAGFAWAVARDSSSGSSRVSTSGADDATSTVPRPTVTIPAPIATAPIDTNPPTSISIAVSALDLHVDEWRVFALNDRFAVMDGETGPIRLHLVSTNGTIASLPSLTIDSPIVSVVELKGRVIAITERGAFHVFDGAWRTVTNDRPPATHAHVEGAIAWRDALVVTWSGAGNRLTLDLLDPTTFASTPIALPDGLDPSASFTARPRENALALETKRGETIVLYTLDATGSATESWSEGNAVPTRSFVVSIASFAQKYLVVGQRRGEGNDFLVDAARGVTTPAPPLPLHSCDSAVELASIRAGVLAAAYCGGPTPPVVYLDPTDLTWREIPVTWFGRAPHGIPQLSNAIVRADAFWSIDIDTTTGVPHLLSGTVRG